VIIHEKEKLIKMEPLVLKAHQLHKSFLRDKKKISIIRGINLEVYRNEKIAITGHSGVGKSTLLHILGTLESPTAGKVLFGPHQENVFEYPEKKLARFRNRNLGFIFQFHYLLAEFSALENVMMPALIAGYKRDWAKMQARKLLEQVGLEHRLHHYPNELSGGEQQRVAIARAVILKPLLILADEPTGSLDSASRFLVIQLLLELQRNTGVAMILVTHEQELSKQMDRILVVEDGVFIEGKS